MRTQTEATQQSSLFTSMLQVAFIVLKVLGKVTWSWWWVLSPTWIPLLLAAAILIVWLIVVVLIAVIK